MMIALEPPRPTERGMSLSQRTRVPRACGHSSAENRATAARTSSTSGSQTIPGCAGSALAAAVAVARRAPNATASTAPR